MEKLEILCDKMIAFYKGDPKRIQHFIKVHAFAGMIALREGMDGRELEILEAAAYTHDIGIKPAEEKYGISSGKYQELEGPAPARRMLSEIGFDEEFIDRVTYLIAHHHTYGSIDGMDYQILVEADFLVNHYEDGSTADAVRNTRDKIFKTRTGTAILDVMFGL
ncbi:MAG: HD domain-containing protein [Oscillospiraceae bacterium]